MPVVFVDRPPTGLSADTIRHDDAAGTRMAMSHFQEQGHRRIVFVSDRLDPVSYTHLTLPTKA